MKTTVITVYTIRSNQQENSIIILTMQSAMIITLNTLRCAPHAYTEYCTITRAKSKASASVTEMKPE